MYSDSSDKINYRASPYSKRHGIFVKFVKSLPSALKSFTPKSKDTRSTDRSEKNSVLLCTYTSVSCLVVLYLQSNSAQFWCEC